jgi:hypothetical protein
MKAADLIEMCAKAAVQEIGPGWESLSCRVEEAIRDLKKQHGDGVVCEAGAILTPIGPLYRAKEAK